MSSSFRTRDYCVCWLKCLTCLGFFRRDAWLLPSSSSAKRFELPPNTSDHVARELLLVASTFYKTASKLKLENLVWQDFRAEEHLKEMIVDQSLPQAKLIWLDPFYQERFQPKLSQPNESILMRGLLDAVSMDGTVVLVFGRPNLLFRYWAEPVFGDGVNSSKVRWFVDPSLFIVQRSKLRDKHTRNNRVWHSMTEYVLTVTRVPHVKSKSKGSRDPMLALPQSRKYTTTFANKYGPDNGKPSNFYANYEPPTQRTRLRDYKGLELRQNAEKTLQLCEFFMDLFTDPNELVLDLFAGTASMGMACIKGGRKYFGCDTDHDLVEAARVRLGRTLQLAARGALGQRPGMSRPCLEQVLFIYL